MLTFDVTINWENGFKQKYSIAGNKNRPIREGAFLNNLRWAKDWFITDGEKDIVLKKGDQYESA